MAGNLLSDAFVARLTRVLLWAEKQMIFRPRTGARTPQIIDAEGWYALTENLDETGEVDAHPVRYDPATEEYAVDEETTVTLKDFTAGQHAGLEHEWVRARPISATLYEIVRGGPTYHSGAVLDEELEEGETADATVTIQEGDHQVTVPVSGKWLTGSLPVETELGITWSPDVRAWIATNGKCT